ncbi:MAG: hypothetical protein L6Q92_00205 [Phycisphaerae bacterium]|nr:hypothetical protein [Phycisphaerae bacterium]
MSLEVQRTARLRAWIKRDGEGRMRLEAAGIEPIPDSLGNQGGDNQSGAECGARGARNAPLDPELAAVVDAWPTLAGPIRAGILAMIHAAKGNP